jgi:hypothetical protein
MKIPRLLFQTSLLKPPLYLVERIKDKSKNWVYIHFLDKDIINFMKLNPIDEFNNCIEIFHSLRNGAHKADLFRYYYLYINGGVYMDSDAILENDLDEIVKELDFFTVMSNLKNNSMFNGFIGSIPKHPIIYQALKHICCEENIKKNNADYFNICKELYNIIENYVRINNYLCFEEEFKNNSIFIEEIIDDKTAVTKNKNGEIILTHYYNKTLFIPSLYPIDKKSLTQHLIKPIKIGITLKLPDKLINLFSNGIQQNVIYLEELFLNMGYHASFIITDDDLSNCPENELNKIFYRTDFNVVKFSEILSYDFDVIFVLGFEIPKPILKILKYLQRKIVYYACGNSYFIDSEKVLYSQHTGMRDVSYINKNEFFFDEIWSIPQMYHSNKCYFETLYRCKCIEAPFVWSNQSIQITKIIHGAENDKEYYYKKKDNGINIAIFEPNLSIMKWCFPALLVCENAYRKDKSEKKQITKVFLNNVIDKNNSASTNNFNLDALNKIVKTLDLFEDNKISIESRYNTLFFMSKFADIAVSHQMNNPLNYLYLDLAWMGWPIIHNASLCKDIGYYYEDFNYDMGGDMLEHVMLTHESNKDEYLEKNRKIIDKYLPTNLDLQNKYKLLIEDLFIQ